MWFGFDDHGDLICDVGDDGGVGIYKPRNCSYRMFIHGYFNMNISSYRIVDTLYTFSDA
jgi:hypothetical protein